MDHQRAKTLMPREQKPDSPSWSTRSPTRRVPPAENARPPSTQEPKWRRPPERPWTRTANAAPTSAPSRREPPLVPNPSRTQRAQRSSLPATPDEIPLSTETVWRISSPPRVGGHDRPPKRKRVHARCLLGSIRNSMSRSGLPFGGSATSYSLNQTPTARAAARSARATGVPGSSAHAAPARHGPSSHAVPGLRGRPVRLSTVHPPTACVDHRRRRRQS